MTQNHNSNRSTSEYNSSIQKIAETLAKKHPPLKEILSAICEKAPQYYERATTKQEAILLLKIMISGRCDLLKPDSNDSKEKKTPDQIREIRIDEIINTKFPNLDFNPLDGVRCDFFQQVVLHLSKLQYDHNSIYLRGVKFIEVGEEGLISKTLKLSGLSISPILIFEICEFHVNINLNASDINGIRFINCEFNYSGPINRPEISNHYYIWAGHIRSNRTILFEFNRFTSQYGIISFKNSIIEKDFKFTESTFSGDTEEKEQPLIDLGYSVISGHCLFRELKIISGEYRSVICLKNTLIKARLRLDKLTISQHVRCSKATLSLQDVEVRSTFTVSDSNLRAQSLESVNCDRAQLSSLVIEENKKPENSTNTNSEFFGTLNLEHSRINSNVDLRYLSIKCYKATFLTPDNSRALKRGLDISSMNLKGNLLLSKRFKCEGEVNLENSRIEGNFFLGSSKLSNRGGKALSCKHTDFHGSVLFSKSGELLENINAKNINHTKIFGKVSFFNSRVKGSIDFSNCTYHGLSPFGPFKEFRDSILKKEYTGKTVALDLHGLQVDQETFLNLGPRNDWPLEVEGILDLRNSNLNQLHISPIIGARPENIWRTSGMNYNFIYANNEIKNHVKFKPSFFHKILHLFTFYRLVRAWYKFDREKAMVDECLWFDIVDRTDNVHQPYEELARAFNRMGDHEKARFVRFISPRGISPQYKESKFMGYRLIPWTALKKLIRFLIIATFYGFYRFGMPAYKSILMIGLLLVSQTFFRVFKGAKGCWDEISSILLSYQMVYDNLSESIQNSIPFLAESKQEHFQYEVIFQVLVIIFLALFIVDLARWNKSDQ